MYSKNDIGGDMYCSLYLCFCIRDRFAYGQYLPI